LTIETEAPVGPLFVTTVGNTHEVEYIVLTRRNADTADLTDLQGGSLLFYDNPRTCLAKPWLEAEIGGKPLSAFFRSVDHDTKLTKTVLPVFFGQADACLVTRDGYDTMCELNPQIGSRLRIIAASPGLVTMVFFVREGYDAPFRDDFLRAMASIHENPSGLQILSLLRGDRIDRADLSCLDSARRILAARKTMEEAP
jgi:phosphonate transport system substrate-binding protein